MLKKAFDSPYRQYSNLNGRPFRVIREITEPDERHDEECLPVYVIQFEDGKQIEAYPEEVLAVEKADVKTAVGKYV